MFRDLAASRGLARELAARTLKAQYRQAALGMVWMLVVPFANVAAWLFVQSSGAVRIEVAGMPYAAFLVSGILLWSIFIDAANAPLQQVRGATQMLSKLNFPREALLLSGLYQTGFSAAAKMLILVVVLAFLGISPGHSILFLPIAIAALIACGTVLGIAITPIGILYGDIGRALPFVLQFLMFLSPVVYAAPRAGWAASLMNANPMTPVVEFGRAAAVGTGIANMPGTLAVLGGALMLTIAAWVLFRLAMPILIERMGT
jgi:lipopolysaccharide transport system permease protein